MKANYHTHTFRCHHGYGCEWEYVEKAIAEGLEVLGFADHTPMVFPPSHRTKTRMKPERLFEYAETVERLRGLYGDRITLLCGLEAEYYPDLFSEYLDLLRQVKGIQYLIMGQHYLENEYENPLHCFKPTEEPARLVQYVDQVTEGLATGRFLYLAHPDVLNFQGDDAFYKEQMRRLCRNVKELGVPLELNLQGYRAGKNYPDRRFWEIAAEENCTAVIGCDAHRVRDVADPAELAYIRGFAEELGLKIAEKLALREDFLK